MTTQVQIDGPDGAPPLLLLPGTAASPRSWDPLVPLLTGAHRVIRPDLIDGGRSADPEYYAIPEQARRAAAVLDGLGGASVTAVGHSAGGWVATALADQRPDLVGALALIDSGPRMDAYIAPDLAIEPGLWSRLTDEEVRGLLGHAFGPGYEIPAWVLDELRQMTFEAFAAASQAGRAYVVEKAIPSRLTALGKPVLVIFGEEDRRWHAPASIAGYREVPGARVEPLPGTGHSPNLEAPERTAELLLAFTAALPAP